MQLVGRSVKLFNENLKSSVCDISVPACEDGGEGKENFEDWVDDWVLRRRERQAFAMANQGRGLCRVGRAFMP